MELETWLLIVGRILLASLFICAGIKHCFLAKVIVPMIAARGIPYSKAVFVSGSAFEFIAGVLLALGIQVFWASLGLAAFTIGATVMLVNFWDMQGPPPSLTAPPRNSSASKRGVQKWTPAFAGMTG